MEGDLKLDETKGLWDAAELVRICVIAELLCVLASPRLATRHNLPLKQELPAIELLKVLACLEPTENGSAIKRAKFGFYARV